MRFPWLKPIVLRSSDEKHRQASWLELFTDLCFVVAISSTSKIFEDGFSINRLLVYAAIFLAIFWIWNRFTWYATHYDNDDVPFRLSFLAVIFCVIGMSASIEGILLGSYTQFTLYYLAIEFVLLYLWSRVWRRSQNKIQAKCFFISYLIGTLLIVTSISVKNEAKLLLWILAVLIEAIGPIVAWYKTRSQIPVHTSHIIERHGLFTIILLGEGIVAISNNMSSSLSLHTLISLIISYGIVVSLWWIYFDYDFGATNLSHNMLRTFIFGYGQFFVFFTLSITTVSLEYGLHSVLALEHAQAESINVIKNMLIGGVSGFLLVVGTIQVIISQRNHQQIYLARWAGAIAIGLTWFFQAELKFETVTLILLFILVSIVVNDTYHWGKLKKEL